MSTTLPRLVFVLALCLTLTGCGYLTARRQAEAARQAMQAEAAARAQAEDALAKLEQAKVVAPPETELEAKADEVKRKIAADEIQKQLDKGADAIKGALGTAPPTTAKAATDPSLLRTLEGHEAPVLGVAYSPDGKRVASASADKTVRVWNAKTGELVATLTGHKDEVTCVAFTADGKRVVSGSADKTLKIWDLEAKKELKSLEGHTDAVTCLAVFADGKQLISGSMDKSVRVWNLESGLPLGICNGHTLGVLCVAVTDNGGTAVSGGQDRTVRVWTLGEKPKELGRLEPHKGWVKGVAIADDNENLLSVGMDGQFAVSRLTTGGPTLTHKKDTQASAIHCAAFRNSNLALLGLEDKTLRQLHWLNYSNYDFTNYQANTYSGHQGPVLAVTLSPDGLIAVSGGEDKTVRLWKVTSR